MFYLKTNNMLVRELDKLVNMSMSRSIRENQNISQYETVLKEFKSNDIKIIIGVFDLNTTLRLFCEVYRQKMYGEKYQWIILGSYKKELLYSLNDGELNCTTEEILEALNGTLQTRVVEYGHEFQPTFKESYHKISARANSFEKKCNNFINDYISNYHHTCRLNKSSCLRDYFHGYAFDGLLAIYYLLSSLIESRKFNCNNLNFERNIDWFTTLNTALGRLSFRGVTVSPCSNGIKLLIPGLCFILFKFIGNFFFFFYPRVTLHLKIQLESVKLNSNNL